MLSFSLVRSCYPACGRILVVQLPKTAVAFVNGLVGKQGTLNLIAPVQPQCQIMMMLTDLTKLVLDSAGINTGSASNLPVSYLELA